MSQSQGPKLRLRYLNGTPRRPPTRPLATVSTQIIRQNLEPLKQNTKKKVAQKLYYQNHPEHQSPLVRDDKGPVHQRLGVKQIRLKRLVPLGTNTSSVLPKMKLSKPQNNNRKIHNTPGNFKRHKMQRLFSAQSRIERIRLQQRNNTSGMKLRRLHNGLPPATNLTVQVNNPNFVPPKIGQSFVQRHSSFHKFKMILNSEIQAEILEIQTATAGTIGSLPPSTTITPVTTELLISTRFGLL